jgi:hypothetical protein
LELAGERPTVVLCLLCGAGGYTWEDQEPDADLGKSITPGFRNVTADTRAFG